MNITIFVGDIADATADALCTSTNPRLSLVMGTGAAIRRRGGDAILRACESIAEGRLLPAGSVHVTAAGTLASKCVIHCVASDAAHNSSEEIVKRCVSNALVAADANGCRTIAMPLFASGHARLSVKRSVQAMTSVLAGSASSFDCVLLVITDDDRIDAVRSAIELTMPSASISVERSTRAEDDDEVRWW